VLIKIDVDRTNRYITAINKEYEQQMLCQQNNAFYVWSLLYRFMPSILFLCCFFWLVWTVESLCGTASATCIVLL